MIGYDPFCGCGGVGLGLSELDVPVIGFDNWKPAIQSHLANKLPALLRDLNYIDWNEFKQPEFVWGSPPCQPFSTSGHRANLVKGQFDPRDGIPAFLKAVKELQPQTIFMENVRALTFKTHRRYLENLVVKLERLGYKTDGRILNYKNFGGAQSRERLFIIGKKSGEVVWPESVSPKSMRELFPYLQKDTQLRIARMGWNAKRKWKTLDEQSNTLAFGGDYASWEWMLNGVPRKLHITEALALQGFPTDFKLIGNKQQQFTQVGNAVPPIMAKRLVELNI